MTKGKDSHIFSETFFSIYYPLIILKTWYKPSTLIAKTMCQYISVVNIADDKNSILTQKRCSHLSDPVPSVRIPGVKNVALGCVNGLVFRLLMSFVMLKLAPNDF